MLTEKSQTKFYEQKDNQNTGLKANQGFTLVEILLYTALISIMLFAVSDFYFLIIKSRVKNQTIAEVEQQAAQAIQMITQTARNAENVTSPGAGGSAAFLTLDAADAAKDSTIFDLSGGAIRIKEGVGSPIVLTNSRVIASGLNFQNLSYSGTPGIIRVSFTLSRANPENRNEYNYSKTFYASASLR